MSLGRSWGYAGVELRLIDGELIDPAMPAESRARVKRTLASAGLPAVAVDSSIRLTGDDPDSARIRATVRGAISGEPPKKGGILNALRRSPLVGADLDLKRPVTAGRKVDL